MGGAYQKWMFKLLLAKVTADVVWVLNVGLSVGLHVLNVGLSVGLHVLNVGQRMALNVGLSVLNHERVGLKSKSMRLHVCLS